MRKINSLRVAASLAIATLATTCCVGGTFAKYVTTDSGTDSARVAKFGVTITASADSFAKEYATDDSTVVGTIAKSVVTSDDDDVVAPGTKGSLTMMTISGTPEVAVSVKYESDFELGDKWVDADGNYYCPLTITIDGTDFYGLNYASVDAFESAVETKLNNYSANYPANTDLAKTLPVSWKWDFEGADGGEVTRTDAKDTYLGDQAAAGNAGTITLALTTTVTQID